MRFYTTKNSFGMRELITKKFKTLMLMIQCNKDIFTIKIELM
jgi:hypothetical protein